MNFLKKIFQSDPIKKLQEDINAINIGKKAINLYEKLIKHDQSLIHKVVDENILESIKDGNFIGNQGWFLPNYQERMDLIWEKLKNGSVDLKKIGDNWGLNAKRTFIAISDHASSIKLNEPHFIREGEVIFLTSYLKQIWADLLSTIDLEENEKFDTFIEKTNISREHLALLKKNALHWLKEEKSEFALGMDNFLRRKDDLLEEISGYIDSKWEEKTSQLLYSDIAERFGITLGEITRYLQKLSENNSLSNSTIYPVDEMLKPRSL